MSDTLADTSDQLDYQDDQAAESGGGGYAGPPIPPSAPPAASPQPGTGGPPLPRYAPQPTAAQRWAAAKDEGQSFVPAPFVPPGPLAGQDKGFWHDMVDRGWAAAEQMGDDVLGAVQTGQQIVGDSPEAKTWLQGKHQALQQDIAATLADMSPARQKAAQASIFGGKDEQGNAYPSVGEAGYFNVAADRVISFLPNLLLAATPGGIPGRVLSAVMFGALDAGGAYNAMADQIGKMTQAEKAQAPIYAEAVKQGQTDPQATQTLLHAQAVSWQAAGRLMAGAAAGAGLGGVLRGGVGAAGRGLAARMGVGAAEGAATLGGQAGADTALQQSSEKDLGQRQEFDPEAIARAVASGAMGGLVVGAGGGALHRGEAPAPAPAPDIRVTGVDPTMGAAMSEALGPAPPPSFDPTNPAQGQMFGGLHQQGELFTGAQAGQAPPTGVSNPAIRGMQPGVAPGAAQQDLFDPANQPRPAAPVQQELPLQQPNAPTTAATPPVSPPNAANPPQNLASTVVPPAQGAAPPAPTPAPTVPVSRSNLLRALVSAGEDPATLKDLTVSALRRRYESLQAPAPATTSGDSSGPSNTNVVNVPSVASAIEPPTGVLTSSGPTGSPPPEQQAPAPVEPAGNLEVAPTPAPPAAEPGPASPGSVAQAGASETPPAAAEATPPPNRDTQAWTDDDRADAAKLAKAYEGHPAVENVRRQIEAGKTPTEIGNGSGNPFTPWEARALAEHYGWKAEPAEPAAKVLTKDEELRAAAAAKRAAQKAKLAKPEATPIPASAHVADKGEVPPKELVAEPAATPFDPVATVTKIRDAAARAGRMEGLPPAIVEGWVRDVMKVVSGAKSEAEAHAALAGWGGDPGPVAGAKVQRAVVADNMMKLLTGKGLKGRPDLGEEARVEAAGQSSVFEKEGVAAKADLEAAHARDQDVQASVEQSEGAATVGEAEHQAGEEKSQGVADYSAGGEKTRAVETTDKTRVLSDLEQKVRTGTLDVTEAEALYGEKEGRGRNRTYSTVADWIRERLDPNTKRTNPKTKESIYEADPARRAELTQALDEHARQQADPVGYALARDEARLKAAEEKSRVAELARQQAVRARAVSNSELEAEREAAHAPAPLSNEAEARAARVAAFKAAGGKTHFRYRAVEDGIKPGSSRFVQVARDPRLNTFLTEELQRRSDLRAPYPLHEALAAVINHSGVRAEMRPMHELAKRLLKWAPNISVLTPNDALRGDHIDAATYNQYAGHTVSGHFTPAHEGAEAHIVMDPHGDVPVETLLHEALHAVTHRYIDRVWDEGHAKFQMHPDIEALYTIAEELTAHADQADSEGLFNLDLTSAVNASAGDPHETLAWLMTNPDLQEFAAGRVASDEFRAKMAQLGLTPRDPGRSIWRYFTDWVRRAIGLKSPASASEYTLLDHIMRPLQDITNRAVRENARDLPRDPELHAQAAPVYRVATDVLGERGEKLRADLARAPSAITDKMRPAVLAATNFDQIVTGHQPLFEPSDHLAMPAGNPLVRARDATEAIQRSTSDFRDKFIDRNEQLIKDAHKLGSATYDAVGKLVNDATIAEASLTSSDPKANLHLTTPEQLATLAALKARYDALPEAARGVQSRLIKTHDEMGAEERRATLAGAMATAFPESTEAQRAAFAKVAQTKDGLEKFMADPDNSELAKAYGPHAWAKQREMAKLVAKGLDGGWVRGDYVPLRRTGDFVVQYGEKGTPSYGLEMFERRADAEARYDELKKAGVDQLGHVDLRSGNALRELANGHPMTNELEGALRSRPDLAPHAEAIRDLMNKIIFEAGARSDASRLKRRGIQGASTDFARVLAKETENTANRVGYKEHGGERFRALKDMDLVADDLAQHGQPGQSRVARQVHTEIQKRVTTQEAPGGMFAGLSRAASSFGYVQSLMSWSHMFTSSIETHTSAIPQIAARHGMGRTTLEMSRTLAGLAPQMLRSGVVNTMKAIGGRLENADWNLAKVMGKQLTDRGWNPAHVARVINMLQRTNLVDHDYYRELRRIAGGGKQRGVFSQKSVGMFEKFSDMMAASGHAVDAMNKTAVAMAAFHLEYRKTGSLDLAERYAEQRIRAATPNYNLGNKNRFSTSAGPLGGAAAPLTQFKQYGLFTYGVLGNLAKASIRGSAEMSAGEARKALAGVLASHALMAGTLTLIADPLRYVGGAYDWITGAKKPHDYQNNVRGWMSDTFGPELGALVARGAGEELGASIHRRTGYANMLEIPELESFDKAGFMKMVGSAMTGAAGEDLETFAMGLQKLFSGDIYGGIKQTVPRPLRDAMKAAELATQGVADSRGKTILPANKVTPYDIGLQAIGFNPTRVAEAREGRNAVLEKEEEWKSERSGLVQRWLQADQTDRPAIFSNIREWNQDHHGMGITFQQLVKDLEEQRKQSHAPFGLRLPAKASRELAEAGRFAVQ